MMRAYASGDPYLEFAKLAGAVPPDATKKSHPEQRSLYKATVLAVNYGMGAESLAERVQQPVIVARDLLRKHRGAFRTFWQWSDGNVDYALLHKRLWTVFGWQIQVAREINSRRLANFPMQANGAEMMRIACILMTEAGIRVCAPVHDAVLIEAPLEVLDEQIVQARALMAQASRDVLNGFELGTDVEEFRTDWVYRLFKCSRIAIVVGMLIRYWSVLERSDTISVTSMKLKDSQISKNQKAKALRELEDSGLILVERLPGKNPIVQIQGEHRHDGNYSKLSNRTPTR